MRSTVYFSAILTVLLVLLGYLTALRLSAPEKSAPAEPIVFSQKHDAETQLRILRGDTVETMDMGTYLLGVLRAEMPASFEIEALKAQAVAARTYTLYRMRGGIAAHPQADACDDINCCKAYQTAEEAAHQWGDMAVYYEEKLLRAVTETDGQTVCYNAEPILAVFCSSTNGHTQSSGAVWQTDLPYLVSVDSPETEESVPNYHSTVHYTAEELRTRLSAAYSAAKFGKDPSGWITKVERNDAGFVTYVTVGGVRIKGNNLRSALDLRSPSFTVSYADGVFTFAVTGYGHGVGMSQYGANELARQGMAYDAILEHYFTGARVCGK